MDRKIKFNKTNIEKLAAKEKLELYWDDTIIGFGVRVLPSGAKTFFYQGRAKGKLIKITIGRFGNLTVEAARKKAKEHASTIALGINPNAEAKQDKSSSTFGDMLTAYVELLQSKGKESARAVETTLHKNVKDTFPKLWKKQATEINLDDCVKIIGKLVDENKRRQADKLRSYIRTAFSEAINARGNVNAPLSLREINVTTNPARDMRKVDGSSNTDDRVLERPEFVAYWDHVKELPEPARSVAMLHVLTGGQRQAQLARVTLKDVDMTSKSITLYDNKGRREKARRHVVPLLPEAIECIKRLTIAGDYIFSCNGGISPVNVKYLGDIVSEINDKMEKSGELLKGRFKAGCIRASVETRLADRPYRVSSDVLAQLLSHGLGGVQNRHYQRYDYFEDKFEALEMLNRMVEGLPEPQAQVVNMRAAG
jgi:integrase